MFERYELNDSGRDFVVGDVHGDFDLLRKAMKRVGFDKSCDRLFSVGDLVDRGPRSIEAVQWIGSEPWFHPVRGNHEQMAINYANGHDHAFQYERNGGRWFIDLDNSTQQAVASAFQTLPYALEVWTNSGLVGIVHAESFVDWSTFRRQIQAGDKNAIETALWAREKIDLGDDTPVSNVSAIYVGHTPVHKPTCLGNVFYIDTGAIFGGSLTIASIDRFALSIPAGD